MKTMNNTYEKLAPEKLDAHLQNFLVEHLSVSAVSTFIRNEKAFEKYYVFKNYSDVGLSAPKVIGTVYHKVLEMFFETYRDHGKQLPLERLLDTAYRELDKVELVDYKVYANKTSVQVKDQCQMHITNLIHQFLEQVGEYLKDIKEVVFIEERIIEFIVLCDISIPLPFKAVPDIVYINHEDELCGLDHKSKGKYTQAREAHLSFAYQSTTYDKTVTARLMRPEFKALRKKYPKIANGMKWFFFYENKYTKNRDKSPQIKKHKIDMVETRELYENMFFEPVWRTIQAVQDPDYIYLMNPADNYEDAGEMVDFWVKTHLDDLSEFQNLDEKQKALLSKRRSHVKKTALAKVPKSVVESVMGSKKFVSFDFSNMKDKAVQERIQLVLRAFNVNAEVRHTVDGYSCTTYLLRVGVGTKISSIRGHKLDIAQALEAETVRVLPDLVPYEGQTYVAIEVNKPVDQRQAAQLPAMDEGVNTLPIGADNFGEAIFWDLDDASTPHFMVSGASGSGKSYQLATMIDRALKTGMDVVIFDPKNEEKFDPYRELCQVYVSLEDIENQVEELVEEMDRIQKHRLQPENKKLIIFDEVADCLARQTKERRVLVDKYGEEVQQPAKKITEARSQVEAEMLRDQWEAFSKAKERRDRSFKTLEQNLLILGQKARSAGIHLVLAAQRFSTKILTGDVKANFTIRLALKAAKAVDSQVMLDEDGAEKLAGNGDGLLVSPNHSGTVRVQCFSR